MDRLISDEERIKRAEDVIERRKNTDLRISSENFSAEKSNTKARKMIIQILICLLIYCGIYYVKNSNNELLKKTTESIKSILTYDIDFKKMYNEICNKYQQFNQKINQNHSGGNNEANNTNSVNETMQNEMNVNNMEQQSAIKENMGIGGSQENTAETNTCILSEEEQMLIDAKYINDKFNIINPLNGATVTSKFGVRESNAIVSANHKGIDLGAVTGTEIIAAMDGIVTEASSEGDFGVHLKIYNDDIVTIYGHCSELLVKEGDKISKGQKIAKVGSTGKATGPHLHFEIRRENRAVNPEYLLQF